MTSLSNVNFTCICIDSGGFINDTCATLRHLAHVNNGNAHVEKGRNVIIWFIILNFIGICSIVLLKDPCVLYKGVYNKWQ